MLHKRLDVRMGRWVHKGVEVERCSTLNGGWLHLFESLLKFIVYIKVNIIQKWDVGDLWRCMPLYGIIRNYHEVVVCANDSKFVLQEESIKKKNFGLDF
jgi:hypothetical protein